MGRQFRDFTIHGRRYRVAHLTAHILSGRTDAHPQENVKALVTYRSHCWSEDYDSRRHTPDLAFKDEIQRRRAFSIDRHRDSLALPELMADAWEANVGWTNRKNYVLTVGLNGEPYSVFFSLMPSKNRKADVHCLVQTAYRKAVLPKHVVQRFRFRDAVDHVLRGQASGTVNRDRCNCAEVEEAFLFA